MYKHCLISVSIIASMLGGVSVAQVSDLISPLDTSQVAGVARINEFKLTYSLEGNSAYHHLVFTGDSELDAASYLKFSNDLRDESASTRIACDPRLPLTLAELQRRTGEHIIIYSGYRTRDRNDSVDGAERSHHLNCSALDFELTGHSAKEAAVKAVAVMDDLWGKHFGGVGVNHTTLHIDAGSRRFWQKR